MYMSFLNFDAILALLEKDVLQSSFVASDAPVPYSTFEMMTDQTICSSPLCPGGTTSAAIMCMGHQMRDPTFWLAIIGFLIIVYAMIRNVKGSIVFGIIFVTVISWFRNTKVQTNKLRTLPVSSKTVLSLELFEFTLLCTCCSLSFLYLLLLLLLLFFFSHKVSLFCTCFSFLSTSLLFFIFSLPVVVVPRLLAPVLAL
jgi:xanthine/uracil/vitamin C permease (AzgA family)